MSSPLEKPEGISWDPASVELPTPPMLPPGADAMSMTISAALPMLTAPLAASVASLQAKETMFSGKVVAAQSAYENADDSGGQSVGQISGMLGQMGQMAQQAGQQAAGGGGFGQMMQQAMQATQSLGGQQGGGSQGGSSQPAAPQTGGSPAAAAQGGGAPAGGQPREDAQSEQRADTETREERERLHDAAEPAPMERAPIDNPSGAAAGPGTGAPSGAPPPVGPPVGPTRDDEDLARRM